MRHGTRAASLPRFAAYCPACLRVYARTRERGPWQQAPPIIGCDVWERLQEAVRWHLAGGPPTCRVMYADRTEVIFRRAAVELGDRSYRPFSSGQAKGLLGVNSG
jgi:hypothetical protein